MGFKNQIWVSGFYLIWCSPTAFKSGKFWFSKTEFGFSKLHLKTTITVWKPQLQFENQISEIRICVLKCTFGLWKANVFYFVITVFAFWKTKLIYEKQMCLLYNKQICVLKYTFGSRKSNVGIIQTQMRIFKYVFVFWKIHVYM